MDGNRSVAHRAAPHNNPASSLTPGFRVRIVGAAMQPTATQCDGGARTPRLTAWAARVLAVAYAAIGVSFMLFAAPKVPYADPYRYLARYLTLPFPDSALAADNGHREVLPNLVRVAELHWLDANQWLQIGLGVAFAVAATWTILGAVRGATGAQRIAAATLVCVGVFWLGNSRKLCHANESLHLFLVVLSLGLGLRAILSGRTAGVAVAAAAGIVSTLSFGAGPACFVPFFLLLVLRRAPLAHWLVLGTGAAIGAAALQSAGGGDSVVVRLAPLEQLGNLLRWLGAPFVWAASPLLDVAHAERLPPPFDVAAGLVARPVEAAFGPHLVARWPATALGALGLALMSWQTVRQWRLRDEVTRPERFALGLAWFGAGVGALVVLARLTYFRQHPDQLISTRYVPWASLFWTALALLFVLRPGRSPRVALWTALAVALGLAPSQVWNGRYALKQRDTADLTAIGAAVGVIGRDFPLVETKLPDLLEAVPLLRAHETAMFAWPETDLLGTRPRVEPIAVRGATVTAVDNLFGTPGSAVTFRLAPAPASRLLLLDATGTARGLAVPAGSGDLWHGWLRGHADAGELRAAVP